MNSIKKLKLVMLFVIGIPLLIGYYFLRFNDTVIVASAFHFYFVLGSAFFSILLSIIAFLEYKRTNVPIVLMIALGFLGVGIIYAFHGFITPNYSLFAFDTMQNQIKLFVFYGDLSRLWIAVFVFSSGVLAQRAIQKAGLLTSIITMTVILTGLMVLLVYIPGFIPNIKHVDGTDTHFSILIKVVTLIFLGTTMQRYYSSYKIQPSVSVMFLIIGLLFVFGSVIIFMISTPWGLLWWMAHVLYLLTYLVISVGVYYNYYHNQKLEYFDVLDEIRQYVNQLDDSNKQLKIMANTDSLTNLPNRKYFMTQLQKMIDESNVAFGLMFIDIDNFKSYNDTYGHDVGDDLLKIAANRIKQVVKSKDISARLAGDEFVVLIKNITKDECPNIATRLIKALKQPVTIDDAVLSIEISIGIAMYPEDGVKGDELLRKSDQAMYDAKKKGKNTYSFTKKK